MPGSWCDSCQDWHEDEEPEPDYYEEEESPMPNLNRDARIAALPQHSGGAVYGYVYIMARKYYESRVYNDGWYDLRCFDEGFRPPNAFGWQLNQNQGSDLLIFDVPPADLGGAAINKLLAFTAAHPFVPGQEAAWCAHNPTNTLPYKYAGQWIAATSSRNGAGRNLRAVSDQRYDCWHCAFMAGCYAVDSVRPYSLPQCYDESTVVPSTMLAPIEVIGDTYTTTHTIKDVTEAIARACGNCGRIGHNSAACEHPKKIFDKVGIEIEGRFNNVNQVISRASDRGMGEGYEDGSVLPSPEPNSPARRWEFQTKPGSLREACQQLVDFYPDETDSSAGMHVHVSFDAAELTLLNSVPFFKYFKERWEAWGARMQLSPRSDFFTRLRGDNDYCHVAGDRPYNFNSQGRYSQLNFSSFGEHGTVECRLLPMFKRASLGVAAVKELIDIYQCFLSDPAAFGHPMYSKETAVAIPSLSKVVLPKKELEVPPTFVHHKKLEMELAELLPPAEGLVRIAMPVNEPVTITKLAEAIRLRSVA